MSELLSNAQTQDESEHDERLWTDPAEVETAYTNDQQPGARPGYAFLKARGRPIPRRDLAVSSLITGRTDADSMPTAPR
jgi:hypothetical protein